MNNPVDKFLDENSYDCFIIDEWDDDLEELLEDNPLPMDME